MLQVGHKDYPFPIPMVRQGEAWLFDTPAGKEEILNRRIGRNELHTIEVMHAYTDAQREYACMKRKGEGTEFAQKFISGEGKKDDLYWETKQGEEESPFGPLIAKATKEGIQVDWMISRPKPITAIISKSSRPRAGMPPAAPLIMWQTAKWSSALPWSPIPPSTGPLAS
ncbi:MAG: DUF2950 domain-containing protein [Proteobacteria bacterium]|nr:DUF2950 domain-containing protein [Pseudomonadota bacterium]MBU4295281.1 DUF2950 domain-containing protein [Pseudomonadota bacterium]